MKVTPIKTHAITTKDTDLYTVLDTYITDLEEKSIVAITSKIVAICEGRVVKIEDGVNKDELIKKEAEWYIPREENKFGIFLTIKYGTIVASSGIDESNGNGYYILWPQNPQKTANDVREYLYKRHGVKNVGVVITDSKIVPLRRGVTGTCVAHSGFSALKNYIDTPDIFGRKLHLTKSNIADSLSATAVTVMGEGDETIPLVLLEDLPFVDFQNRNPAENELDELIIAKEEDVYGKMLTSANWKRGGSK